uniref:Uncharacterized protein n=1 Tax=Bubo bubo TaxID=30461 RepID=A0A8C0EJI6_BUBBB
RGLWGVLWQEAQTCVRSPRAGLVWVPHAHGFWGAARTRTRAYLSASLTAATLCVSAPTLSCALCQAARLRTILEQREKLIKEGKYTPPDYHKGKEESRP